MKKRLFIFLLAAAWPLASFAQLEQPAPVFLRHEFRIGWGGMGFEKAAFHDSKTYGNYRYSGHIFAGYRYSFTNWLGAGMDVDFGNVSWVKNSDSSNHNFQNISIIPSARFTYYRRGIVTMYSGIGVGLNINTGTETDYLGRKTVFAPVFNPVFYAISLNWRNWFGTVELGPLVSLNSKNEIFMAGSRGLSISIGYRL